VYLARIILSEWEAGRGVIFGLIFINTFVKQNYVEEWRMHTALAAVSADIKATVEVGADGERGMTRTSAYPAKTHFFQGCCVPCSTRTHALHCYLCGAGEY